MGTNLSEIQTVMKIVKIRVEDPDCEWSLIFENGAVLTMELNDMGSFISMTTEIDVLVPAFLKSIGKQLEAIAFMAEDLKVKLKDDPGDGYTNIFIVISDGAMNEILQEVD